mmetsp:Transcript_28487/g.63139  ORF Transcript_28487/g.63139 Transcript_28487/m.63139 type:complete len:200 (-) Transcript_28487:861-1460(-)
MGTPVRRATTSRPRCVCATSTLGDAVCSAASCGRCAPGSRVCGTSPCSRGIECSCVAVLPLRPFPACVSLCLCFCAFFLAWALWICVPAEAPTCLRTKWAMRMKVSGASFQACGSSSSRDRRKTIQSDAPPAWCACVIRSRRSRLYACAGRARLNCSVASSSPSWRHSTCPDSASKANILKCSSRGAACASFCLSRPLA